MGNKSYRIRTDVGKDKFLHVQLDQDYDVLEILSLKIGQQQFYRLHTSNYGVIVGRVLANGGFGVPNAKVSLFISKNNNDDVISAFLYPYGQVTSTNEDGIRYNLLPSEKVTDCHNPVGTFPSKQYMLDNDSVLEVFEDYYRYTTKTNDAGDYMFVGVPVGSQTLHMDLDLSDCGVLSQRPYDFLYKGYNIEQFENANQFKTSNTLEELSQIFTQDQTVEVKPFWGDSSDNLQDIGITRADINVNFKFETSCVFLGSVFSDDADNGMSKRCLPRKKMGKMENLKTGEGTIEIIRKRTTYTENESSVEEFQIKGTQLIDGDGTWCFQIPMNLDYMITDEYGNLVPTDNPEKGIATRTRVRFRISMNSDNSAAKYFQAKVLIPNNPKTFEDYQTTYVFGSNTQDKDFKDLFWNNVYSVKSYIPRLQHTNLLNNRSKRFTGIKTVNKPGSNNPFPYNHIRIQFPFYYTLICWLVKTVNAVVYVFNWFKTIWNHFLQYIYNIAIGKWHLFGFVKPLMFKSYTKVSGSFCPELSDRYFIPGAPVGNSGDHGGHEEVVDLYGNTFRDILQDEYPNLTGVTSKNINIPTSSTAQGIWYPLQSGATLYGYYLLSMNSDKQYTGTVYLIGNFTTGATQENKSYTSQRSLIEECFFLGLALGDDAAATNLKDEYVFAAKYSQTANSLSSLVSSFSSLYSWRFKEESIAFSEYKPSKTTYFKINKGKLAYTASNFDDVENSKITEIDYYSNTTLLIDYIKQVHMPDGKAITTTSKAYDSIKESIIASINVILNDLILNYNGDINSIEYKSSYLDTQIDDNNDEKICLHPKTDYLVSCIEYNLAEELDIINFDFYNDWINGAIYMPRWARTIKIRKINGKTKLRSCSDDSNNSLKSLTITEISPIKYGNDHSVNVNLNLGWDTWQKRSRSTKLSSKLTHAETYVTDTAVKVFYYVPASFKQKREAILFATDIILLGSISDCNIYGIPSNFDMYLDTTYQMPPDLATTNLAGDDGSAISISDAGCVSLNNIISKDNRSIWNSYINGNSKAELNDKLSEENIPITEEAGVSWNKVGPNQTQKNDNKLDYLYNPGGHFLGLACVESLTQTTLKTNINLLRACEMGVSLSERHEEPYIMDNNVLKNIYVVPNGLINKNDIYDVNSRALFATLNHNELKTTVDTATGYLHYDFKYLYPYGFGGEAKSLINEKDNVYNSTINVNTNISDKDLSVDEKWEKAHTYSRANDDDSYDYKQYRLGSEGGYIGSSQLQQSSLFNVIGQTWNMIDNAMQIPNNTSTIPLFKNSFYFYFGLHSNNTAIDKFRHSYQATCAKRDVVNYRGELNVFTAYTDSTKEKLFAEIQIKDSVAPYTLTIENFINDANVGRFGIYVLGNNASQLEWQKDVTNGVINNWANIRNRLSFHNDSVYEEYDKDVFYVLVDNDLKTQITVNSVEGDVYTRVIGDGGLNLDEYSIEGIPFSSRPILPSLDRTPKIEYGVVTSVTGGYIRTDFPVLENDVFEMEIQHSNGTVFENYKDYTTKIETSTVPVYDIPVPEDADYTIYIKRKNSNKSTYWKTVSVGYNSNENDVYLYNNRDEEMKIPSLWPAHLSSYFSSIIPYIINNLVQYGEPFTKSISLTTRMKHSAEHDFIGQGEKYIFKDNVKELDQTTTISSDTEIDDLIIPTRINDVEQGFSLSETSSYIPTRNYDGAYRRDFYVMYYDTYKVYSDPLAEITIDNVEYENLTYNSGKAFKGNRIEVKRKSRDTVTLKAGEMVILRGGDATSGKEIFITWAMAKNSSPISSNTTSILYTLDDIHDYLQLENLTIALFEAYTLPIFYVNEHLNNLTITLSNRFDENQPFYKNNGLTKVTVKGWYDANTKCLIDKNNLGCKIGNETFKFNNLQLNNNEQTFITDGDLSVFNSAFFNELEKNNTSISLRQGEDSTNISFGEFVDNTTLNPYTQQEYTLEKSYSWESILSAKTKDETSKLILDYKDVWKVDNSSTHILCNEYNHIDMSEMFKVHIRYYAGGDDRNKLFDVKSMSGIYAKGYRICVGLNNIDLENAILGFSISYTGDSVCSYTQSDGDTVYLFPNIQSYYPTTGAASYTDEIESWGFYETNANAIRVSLGAEDMYNDSGFCFTLFIPQDWRGPLKGINEILNQCKIELNIVKLNNNTTAHINDYWKDVTNNHIVTVTYSTNLNNYIDDSQSTDDYGEYGLDYYLKLQNDDTSSQWAYITSRYNTWWS